MPYGPSGFGFEVPAHEWNFTNSVVGSAFGTTPELPMGYSRIDYNRERSMMSNQFKEGIGSGVYSAGIGATLAYAQWGRPISGSAFVQKYFPALGNVTSGAWDSVFHGRSASVAIVRGVATEVAASPGLLATLGRGVGTAAGHVVGNVTGFAAGTVSDLTAGGLRTMGNAVSPGATTWVEKQMLKRGTQVAEYGAEWSRGSALNAAKSMASQFKVQSAAEAVKNISTISNLAEIEEITKFSTKQTAALTETMSRSPLEAAKAYAKAMTPAANAEAIQKIQAATSLTDVTKAASLTRDQLATIEKVAASPIEAVKAHASAMVRKAETTALTGISNAAEVTNLAKSGLFTGEQVVSIEQAAAKNASFIGRAIEGLGKFAASPLKYTATEVGLATGKVAAMGLGGIGAFAAPVAAEMYMMHKATGYAFGFHDQYKDKAQFERDIFEKSDKILGFGKADASAGPTGGFSAGQRGQMLSLVDAMAERAAKRNDAFGNGSWSITGGQEGYSKKYKELKDIFNVGADLGSFDDMGSFEKFEKKFTDMVRIADKLSKVLKTSKAKVMELASGMENMGFTDTGMIGAGLEHIGKVSRTTGRTVDEVFRIAGAGASAYQQAGMSGQMGAIEFTKATENVQSYINAGLISKGQLAANGGKTGMIANMGMGMQRVLTEDKSLQMQLADFTSVDASGNIVFDSAGNTAAASKTATKEDYDKQQRFYMRSGIMPGDPNRTLRPELMLHAKQAQIQEAIADGSISNQDVMTALYTQTKKSLLSNTYANRNFSEEDVWKMVAKNKMGMNNVTANVFVKDQMGMFEGEKNRSTFEAGRLQNMEEQADRPGALSAMWNGAWGAPAGAIKWLQEGGVTTWNKPSGGLGEQLMRAARQSYSGGDRGLEHSWDAYMNGGTSRDLIYKTSSEELWKQWKSSQRSDPATTPTASPELENINKMSDAYDVGVTAPLDELRDAGKLSDYENNVREYLTDGRDKGNIRIGELLGIKGTTVRDAKGAEARGRSVGVLRTAWEGFAKTPEDRQRFADAAVEYKKSLKVQGADGTAMSMGYAHGADPFGASPEELIKENAGNQAYIADLLLTKQVGTVPIFGYPIFESATQEEKKKYRDSMSIDQLNDINAVLNKDTLAKLSTAAKTPGADLNAVEVATANGDISFGAIMKRADSHTRTFLQARVSADKGGSDIEEVRDAFISAAKSKEALGNSAIRKGIEDNLKWARESFGTSKEATEKYKNDIATLQDYQDAVLGGDKEEAKPSWERLFGALNDKSHTFMYKDAAGAPGRALGAMQKFMTSDSKTVGEGYVAMAGYDQDELMAKGAKYLGDDAKGVTNPVEMLKKLGSAELSSTLKKEFKEDIAKNVLQKEGVKMSPRTIDEATAAGNQAPGNSSKSDASNNKLTGSMVRVLSEAALLLYKATEKLQKMH
jgi:hypothetical protein